jgi:ketosteroid isomerase-like protein
MNAHSRIHFTTPQEVELAFYDALTRSDLKAMMQVWSEEEEVICVLPGGARAVGLDEIREAWQTLFSSQTRLGVRLSHEVITSTLTMAVHSVLEHVSINADIHRVSPMIATNAYAMGSSGWRMVLHHVSPIFDADDIPEDETPRFLH